jgi:tetratricopeptide (TPR) repeat protein
MRHDAKGAPHGAPFHPRLLVAPVLAFALALAALTLLNGASQSPAPAARAGGFVQLGDEYLQRFRETGDPAFYSRAQRSFDAALRRDPRDLGAVAGAGTLALSRHSFREALRLGERAQRLGPGSARPFPVLADAQIELGRYPEAARTIQRFVDLKPGLASYARVSYLRELTGDLPGAASAMRLAASAGAGAAENVAYVQTLLGDIELQRGRTTAAGNAYRTALRTLPRSPAASVGLARIEAARGDLRPAIARLRAASNRLPLPGTLTLLAETELVAGHRAAARTDLDLVRAQRRLLSAAGARPDVELVLFEVEHGDSARAVRMGREVYADAPSVRSADALGWALTRAGHPAEGLVWARRALRIGSRDPRFHLHAWLAGGPDRHLRVARRGAAGLSPLEARRLAR